MKTTVPIRNVLPPWADRLIWRQPDPPTFNPDGTLTRHGALCAAREKWGDLGTISSDHRMPLLVWRIGSFDRTVGRGATWEAALADADRSERAS